VTNIAYFDLTQRRRPEVTRLAHLKKGEKIVHDHDGYRTPMRMWISQQRRRLKRDFEVSPIMPGNGQEPTAFKIWWTRRWRKGQRHKASRAVSPHALKLIHANMDSTAKTKPKWDWVYCPKRRQAVRAGSASAASS
jgi:hypothetical protein